MDGVLDFWTRWMVALYTEKVARGPGVWVQKIEIFASTVFSWRCLGVSFQLSRRSEQRACGEDTGRGGVPTTAPGKGAPPGERRRIQQQDGEGMGGGQRGEPAL